MGKLLIIPLIIICIAYIVFVAPQSARTIRETGPQGDSVYTWGAPVPQDHPYYQLPTLVRLIPAGIAAVVILLAFSGSLSKRTGF